MPQSLLTAAFTALFLLGCGARSDAECEKLLAGEVSAFGQVLDAPALSDSLRRSWSNSCEALAALADSVVKENTGQTSTAEVYRLDAQLHQILVASAETETGSDTANTLGTLAQFLATPFVVADTLPLAVRLDSLGEHSAAFRSSVTQLRALPGFDQEPTLKAATELGTSLIDSVHALAHIANLQRSFSPGPLDSPELDSLSQALTRLQLLRGARTESAKAVLDWPPSLGGNGNQALLRETIWQLAQATDLSRRTVDLLQISLEYASSDTLPLAELLIVDAVFRMEEGIGMLSRRASALRRIQTQLPAPEEDSLRIYATGFQEDLVLLERNLAALKSAVAADSVTASQEGAWHLASGAVRLVGEQLQDMGVLSDALQAQMGSDLERYGLKIFLALLIIFAALALIRILIWLLSTMSERSARRRLFFKRLIPVARLAILSAVVYLVLAYVFRLDQGSLLAAGAAVGVAIGFAAQDILKNIFGGIVIIFDQPFQVGDKIHVGGTYGEVVSIGLRATRIVTPDDNLVTVPNAHVIDTQIANANAGALHCQVVVELYVPGWADVARAKEIAYGAAANAKFVFLGKPIVVIVTDEFKHTFLTRLAVKAYVLDARYENHFASEVTETAKIEFQNQGFFTHLPIGRPSTQTNS